MAVIGAGPVGSYTARLLAEEGLRVLILERKRAMGARVVCTGVIGVEAFSKFDLPREDIISRFQAIKFMSPSGKSLLYRPGPVLAFMVDRSKFDRALALSALDRGATLSLGSLVAGIRKQTGGLAIDYYHGGVKREVGASLAVLAAGYSPGLTAKLGLTPPPNHMEGIQAVVNMDMADDEVAEVYLGETVAPGSFAWVAPLGNGRAKLGITARENAPAYFGRFLQCPAIASRLKEGRFILGRKLLPQDPIPKSFADRLLVVGEAAGQIKTTTAGGVYYGLIGAGLAAQVIVGGFRRNDFSAAYLQEYDIAWRKVLGGELAAGYRLRKVARRFSDRSYELLFALAKHDWIMARIYKLVSFDWHGRLIRSRLTRMVEMISAG